MTRKTTAALPPKHGGYRAVQPKAATKTSTASRSVPKPPAGQGGGSRSTKK